MRKLFCTIAAMAVVGLFAGSALADHGSGGLPADKVAAGASNLTLADPNTNDANPYAVTLFGGISYKLSTSGDIGVSVHVECKIVTETTVKGKNAVGGPVIQDSERGFARVWVRIESHDDPTNFIVLNAKDFPAEDDQICMEGTDTTCQAVNAGAVTMCDRKQDLRLTSSGDEELALTLATLQTHGFSWYGEDVARYVGDAGYPIGNEVDIWVLGQVFGEAGGLVQIRKRVVEIYAAHFAN